MATRNVTLSGLGARLRELRVRRELSVRTLAKRAGFSPSFISQMEADAVSPSLASLERIASELGVTLGQLFTSLESAPRTVVRRMERPSYESVWSRSIVEVLADAVPGRKMSAVQVTVAPGGASGRRPAPSPHDTFALVLSGGLVLTTEEGNVELGEVTQPTSRRGQHSPGRTAATSQPSCSSSAQRERPTWSRASLRRAPYLRKEMRVKKGAKAC